MPLNILKDNSPVRPSFISTLNSVIQQVEYQCFTDLRTGYIDPLYKELCLIIAEVFVSNSEAVVKINGSVTSTKLVQEVYEQIRNNHVKLVFANFKDVSCQVYNKKAYLRTALYNAVFELESHFVNAECCL